MPRPTLLLLVLAVAATATGCQYGRKFTAQRDKPANAVMLEDIEAKEAKSRDAGDARTVSRSRQNVAVRGNASADTGRSPNAQRPNDSRLADSRADERATTASDAKPRNGWASMLNPFQPAKAIPVPRNDLPEPADSDASGDTSPASVEDDFDLFGGF